MIHDDQDIPLFFFPTAMLCMKITRMGWWEETWEVCKKSISQAAYGEDFYMKLGV